MTASLEHQASAFAGSLTATVRAVVGDHCRPFRVQTLDNENLRKLTISQGDEQGIVLTRDGEPLVTLVASYLCRWDGPERYLRVARSSIALYYGASAGGAPIFRYEYERKDARNLPGAHLQVHADPDGRPADLASLLVVSGMGTRRAKRRQGKIDRGTYPHQEDFHFPLGGDRFRPALEDILQVLIEELGVDCELHWQRILEDAREGWRILQTKAAVRDAPDAAVAALEDLGYGVTPPEGGPAPRNIERLRAL